ncbi:early boundary activity protein 1 [Eurosta solidaginis]|uniref:early boundary activity protein 1 n=1 Tax=Eurosta solidaginis TaxID=178769 RepID=UPI0035306F72
MSYKKLFWKYNNTEGKENENFDDEIMAKINIFQMLLKMASEQGVADESSNINNTQRPDNPNNAPTVNTDKGSLSAKARYTEYSENNCIQDGALNLVIPKPTEPTVKKKRPAIDDLSHLAAKNRKTMKEIELKQVAKVPAIEPQYESMCFPFVSAIYDEPQNLSSASSDKTHSNTREKKFKHLNRSRTTRKRLYSMDEQIKKILESNVILENGVEMVIIGPNGTKIEKETFHEVNWESSGSAITRKILSLIFDDSILATHSLSGKKSPAFMEFDMPLKGQLDPYVIDDIIYFMKLTRNVTKQEVKMAVTGKCADVCKKLRMATAEE